MSNVWKSTQKKSAEIRGIFFAELLDSGTYTSWWSWRLCMMINMGISKKKTKNGWQEGGTLGFYTAT
jgi:hypothetical protein